MPAPDVQPSVEKEAVADVQEAGEPEGNAPEPLPYENKKTVFIPKNEFYCPSCGNINSKKANYCIHCGTKLAGKPTLKKARIFFVASMIAVPVVVIGLGLCAIFLNINVSDLSKMFLFQSSSSAPERPKVEQEKPLKPALPANFPVENAVRDEALPETKSAPSKAENAGATEKPSGAAKNSVLISKQRPMKAATEPAQNRKTAIEAASGTPVKAKRTLEKTDAEKAAPRSPAQKAVSEQQKQEKISTMLKLAKLYTGIGSYDDAIAQYLDVLMLDPANQEARDGLVKARETKKNTLGK
jgi:hypothetical protein